MGLQPDFINMWLVLVSVHIVDLVTGLGYRLTSECCGLKEICVL